MSKLLQSFSSVAFSLLMAMLLATAGCGSKEATSPAPEQEKPAPAENALDTTSQLTPEGVTDRFFAAFFSGKDQEAWNLLTEKAQEATRENFMAQASDTVNWQITKKDVDEDGMAYVFVEVSDLTETGDRATEELIFALRQTGENQWGVAGFSAGTLAVNFEDTAVESYNASDDTTFDENITPVEPERVGQLPTSPTAY